MYIPDCSLACWILCNSIAEGNDDSDEKLLKQKISHAIHSITALLILKIFGRI